MSTTSVQTAATTTVATSSEATLQQWQADEAMIRARMQAVGISRLDQVVGLSGMEMFEQMLAGTLPPPPISQTLDFILIRFERGRAVFQGKPSFQVLNPMGTVHGGWYATLLDSAVGCAVHTTLPTGRGYTTLELKLNIVRSLPIKVPLVRAEGYVVHAGRQVATAEGRLYDADGALYAHASTTCLMFDLASAPVVNKG